MALQPESGGEDLGKALADLAELRRFTGAPKEFWPRLLAALAVLAGASKATLLLKDAASGRWKTIGDWAENNSASRLVQTFIGQLDSLAAASETSGDALVPLEGASSGRASAHFALVIKQRLLTNQSCLAAFLLSEFSPAAAHEALLRLQLTADVPRCWQEFLAGEQAKSDITSFARTLDLLAEVNTRTRFLAAALAFCNGLSNNLGCDRVSLGWLVGGYVKLTAISRTEKFNRRMAAAQALEAAMDECLDQDEELLWPAGEGQNVVARDHEKYSREQNIPFLCSVPLRLEGKPVAVLAAERVGSLFTPLEVQQLRLACDQTVRRLSELQRHDRWFGARWATWTKEQLAVVVGPKHTWAKVTSLLVVALLAVLFFVRVPYRVEGNFILKSDEVQSRTAPFDGYIQQVSVRPGDVVKAGDKLLQLNTRELELEESASQADLGRYQREAEKARATNGLAEMRVALALADQSQARLDLVRHRLNEATIKSPLNGVVVEGDLRERLAAPVKQGDLLLKIARIENLYVEAEVNERDVHEILSRRRGEIAFVSQPKFSFPVRIIKIEPAAIAKTEGNVFLVRCELEKGVESWWRPGMSGLCKLSVEKRTLWWILTHRTVDFLRMKLWW